MLIKGYMVGVKGFVVGLRECEKLCGRCGRLGCRMVCGGY